MKTSTVRGSDLDDLARRIERLERALQQNQRPGVVEATEVRLIDVEGTTRAVLSVDDGGPFLTFPDEKGEICTESLPLVTWERSHAGPIERARATLWSSK